MQLHIKTVFGLKQRQFDVGLISPFGPREARPKRRKIVPRTPRAERFFAPVEFKLKQQKELEIQQGFSLAELLLSMAIAGIVLILGGAGLQSVTTQNTRQTSQSDRQQELSRAQRFMAEEVRQAIQVDANLTALPTEGTRFLDVDASTPGVSEEPILILRLPNVPQRVIYYLRPSEAPWQGELVVYRLGPPFDLNGNYDPVKRVDPNQWQPQPLIDNLAANPTTVACPGGWQAIPATPTPARGFYACVESQGRMVNIVQTGLVQPATGAPQDYPLVTRVFARGAVTP
jgi:prepilin-type N-terminal cleavage/methylation domain-containing protein